MIAFALIKISLHPLGYLGQFGDEIVCRSLPSMNKLVRFANKTKQIL